MEGTKTRTTYSNDDMALNKTVQDAREACAGIESGMTLMLGGFGLCGIPENAASTNWSGSV